MKKLALFIFILLNSQPSFGSDQTIEMLNKLGKEHMVYSQKIVNIEVGDTIFWKSTKPGHNVEFINSLAIFFDLPRYFIFFISSKFDLLLPTTTKPIIPMPLWGVHQ